MPDRTPYSPLLRERRLPRRTERIVLRDDHENPAEEGATTALRRGLNPLRPQGATEPEPAPEPAPVAEAQEFENWREAAEPPPPNLSPEQRRNIERWRAEVLQSVSANDDGGEPGPLARMLKPANLALMVIALIAGGAAAFLATQTPPSSTATTAQIVPMPVPETVVVKEPMAQVLVARVDIGIGQRLTAESVEWIAWPEDNLSPGFITAATADAESGVDNAVARYDFLKGEPIRETKLTRSAEGFLSAVLDPGTRAVAVAVTAESASGGFVLPNDRVDIVHTTTVNERQVSSTILGNVRVLAINSSLGRTGREEESSDTPKSRTFSSALATLALDPKQAEVIISATMTGRLSLVLRPTADIAEAQPDTRSRAANEAIRLSSPFWAN